MGKTRGIYRKYNISKANGKPIDPEAKYFILRIDNDYDALFAAIYWARKKENQELVDDLIELAKELDDE